MSGPGDGGQVQPAEPARIDAHQHFWDIESGRYAWPTPADGPIYRTFTPDDLQPELVAAGVDATVLVQTVDTLDDTDAMLATADRHAFIAAVVGWVPLTDAGSTTQALDARPDARLRGIRHLIHHERDPEWLLRDDVAAGLRVLAERGLAFDVVAVFPAHLGLVPIIADRHPSLTFVIDHLAKPPIRSEGWPRWREQLQAAAARPNVVAKISGLDTAAGPDWSEAEIRPAVEIAIDAFGPARLMFGSDWPVCRLVSTYSEVIDSTARLVASLSATERRDIMGATAMRTYGIEAAVANGR
jgi:L-fuconolactonase